MAGLRTLPKGQDHAMDCGLCMDIAKGSVSCKQTLQVYGYGKRVRFRKSTLACVWILPKGLVHVNQHAGCMDMAKGLGSIKAPWLVYGYCQRGLVHVKQHARCKDKVKGSGS